MKFLKPTITIIVLCLILNILLLLVLYICIPYIPESIIQIGKVNPYTCGIISNVLGEITGVGYIVPNFPRFTSLSLPISYIILSFIIKRKVPKIPNKKKGETPVGN